MSALDFEDATLGAQSSGIATRALFMDQVEVPGSDSYATGGYELSEFFASLVEQSRTIKNVQGYGTDGSTKVDVRWNATTAKMLVVATATGAQISNATDLHTYTFYLTVWSE